MGQEVVNDNWTKDVKEKSTALDDEGTDAIITDQLERGENRQSEADKNTKAKRKKLEDSSGALWGEKVITMEPSKKVFLYNKDNKEVMTERLRQTKIQARTESTLITKILAWELLPVFKLI